ncbi:uncharacterized protein LOC144655343 [Oculina patagonica]
MSIARDGVCTVADKNSLYVIGGCLENTALDVVERFNPESNCWSRIASNLEKKVHACGAVLRGKVFLFGGITSTERKGLFTHAKLTEMYDPSTNTWSSIDCMGAPQFIVSVVSLKGKIFATICSSLEQGKPYKFSLQVYNIDENKLEYCSSVSTARKVCTVAALRIPRDILDRCKVVPQE